MSTHTATTDDEDEQELAPNQKLSAQFAGSSSRPPLPKGLNDESAYESSAHIHKRRRVTRACDECRRKKIKCDGKQPCTHCTVYSYDCTFDQPSNRRRNPAPAYVESVENRLQKCEAVLKAVLPDVDLTDPNFDTREVHQIVDSGSRSRPGKPPQPKDQKNSPSSEEDLQIQTMVDGTGSLELDDHGQWHYHGTSSAFAFMQNLRAHVNASSEEKTTALSPKSRAMSNFVESADTTASPYDTGLPQPADLPDRKGALELCRNTLEVACSLMRFMHTPTFYKKMHRIYDIDPDHYTDADMKFLPLLYVVLAIGCLFVDENEKVSLSNAKRKATEQGFLYFQTARNSLDIADCRDLTTLQAVVFMIMFLQSTAKLATCYSYIGIALRACCRLGLHRNIRNDFTPIEQEERKRVFWLIRKMDAYVGALLGLPQMLNDEHVDQELPLDVDDEYITEQAVIPMPSGRFPLVRASNAHTSLITILHKVMKFVYPVRNVKTASKAEKHSIRHSKIREIEADFRNWIEELPPELSPSPNAPAELARIQYLLRLSYEHVQMIMYRPFLPLMRLRNPSRAPDKQSYARAVACVNVARNIVHITLEMRKRSLLKGSHWFVMYTSYFSILTLLYLIFDNARSSMSADILKDAKAGREVLDDLARESLTAARCSQSLTDLFAELPHKFSGQKGPLPISSPSRNPKSSDAMKPSPNVQQKSAQVASRGHSGRSKNARSAPVSISNSRANTTQGLKSARTDRGSPARSNSRFPHQKAKQSGSTVKNTDMGLDSRPPNLQQPLPYAPPYATANPSTATGLEPAQSWQHDQPLYPINDTETMNTTSWGSMPQSMTDRTSPVSGSDNINHLPLQKMDELGTIGTTGTTGATGATGAQLSPHLLGNSSLFQSSTGLDVGMAEMDGNFWANLQLNDDGMGLAPDVNLEDVFGADAGWDSVYSQPAFGRPPQ